MPLLTRMTRRIPAPARRGISTLLVVVAAVAVVWLGHASAEKGGPSSDSISKTVAQVPTSKGDAVDATNQVCTVSPQFNDIPDMAKAFKLGGTASRPVIVLFQGQWTNFTSGVGVRIRLTIDGVAQSGPADFS